MIRRADERDIKRLVEMTQRFVAETAYSRLLTSTPEQAEKLAKQALDVGAVFVSENLGRVVGMIALIIAPHFLSGQIVVSELAWWVDPEHRGTATSVRLLLEAESWARENGAEVMAMVAPDSHVAGWYERLGYELVECAYWKRLEAAA